VGTGGPCCSVMMCSHRGWGTLACEGSGVHSDDKAEVKECQDYVVVAWRCEDHWSGCSEVGTSQSWCRNCRGRPGRSGPVTGSASL